MLRLITPVIALGLMACAGDAEETDTVNAEAVEAATEAAAQFGLEVGSAAPDISLTNAAGETVTLADLAGERGTVIYFNRSVDWCPFCQVQTMEIDTFARYFDERGYGVAVITYDEVDELAAFAERRRVSLPLLSDPQSALVDAFDIRDPNYTDPEHYAYGVPYPITFVINTDGIITAKYWHEPGYGEMRGYAERISVADVLMSLSEG
ncbi:peroxiredoxin family protein [Hyphobacterium sp.]|uniref:peroxiredoxin family protein n=1 Tax=Hyphobacterium sp. TaxID=2004662 RepID=UPI003BA9F999